MFPLTRLCLKGSTVATRLILRTYATQGISRPRLAPGRLQRRMMSTPPPQIHTSTISMERYHALSDATMEDLLESLETFLDELGNPAYEVEYHSGVLTLLLGENGTYVINKQPPNKQIWLASPFSGPKRYDYSETGDDWLYSRDNCSLERLLNEELSRVLNQSVDIKLKSPASLVS